MEIQPDNNIIVKKPRRQNKKTQETKPETKPEDKPETKPEDKPETKPKRQYKKKVKLIEDNTNEPIQESTPEIIQPNINTKLILNKNGFRLNKTYYSKSIIQELKNDLTVQPYSQDGDIEPFEIYRETPSELIIPRFYGLTKEKIINKPDIINYNPETLPNLEFTKILRDFQIEIVNKSITHITNYGGGIISVGCGRGKCFKLGTKILMYDGSIQNVENIKIGDKLMGDDTTSREVLSLGTGKEEMFDIIIETPDYAPIEKYTVNKSHILSLLDEDYNIIDISIEDYIKQDKKLTGFRTSVYFNSKPTEIEPYLLGLQYKALKNIPINYLTNDLDVRRKLLVGIIEANNISNILTEFHLNIVSEKLSQDIIYLCRSMSIECYLDISKHIIRIFGYNCVFLPFNMKKYIDSNIYKSPNKHYIYNKISYNITVKPVGQGTYYGFTINNNHRFLLADFTVTHNTVMALNIACHFKLKTLVLVNKSNLQDQWSERTKQFTNAQIGIIRQNKINTKNKDIVIAMIHSISMKDYDPSIFNDFGFIIYDECHHYASRIFSHALYKTGAKYVLGLSATPDRLDRLTKILHWYMGDFIHREINRKNKQVISKIFHFNSTHKLYQEKKRWMKGEVRPDTIKMISNLCELEERTDYIINILNELRKFPERKILILSGRITHLIELKNKFDKILNNDIEKELMLPNECMSCLYTGKSTKEERNKAENEGDIIFATYDLAHEGLDIERLNTIMLVSPKKNIIQAVGRIMRKILKCGDIRPLIIDIADELSVFKFQNNIRVKQYQASKYKIEHINLDEHSKLSEILDMQYVEDDKDFNPDNSEEEGDIKCKTIDKTFTKLDNSVFLF
jgi:superfamily II DNA or RNA helicase